MLKEDVDKRVRNLTKLTKEHLVADLKADFLDFVHPLPKVYIATYISVKLSLVSTCIILCICAPLTYLYAGSSTPCFSSSSFGGRAPIDDFASTASEAFGADESQDEDDIKESEEDTSSSTSPPPSLIEEADVDKKRKRVDENVSSSSAAASKAPIIVEEYFDLLAS
jgi:hypothetical protein